MKYNSKDVDNAIAGFKEILAQLIKASKEAENLLRKKKK